MAFAAGASRTISFDSRLPTTTQISAASAVVDRLGDLRVRRREQVLGEPAEGVPPAGGELRPAGSSGLASNSTNTAWTTISAAITEHTTRTTVARSAKTRAEPLLAMTVMIVTQRRRGPRPSRAVRPVRRGRRAPGGPTAAAAPPRPARSPAARRAPARGRAAGAGRSTGKVGAVAIGAQPADPGRLRAAPC